MNSADQMVTNGPTTVLPPTYAHHISPPHMPIPHMSTTATEQLPNIAFKSPSETGIEISQRPVD